MTPPSEDRVDADLDRLLFLARGHAHEAPSADASASPAGTHQDVEVVAADTLPTVPVLQQQPLADVTPLPDRRAHLVLRTVGQAAAAMVVVAAVGVGALAASDGNITIQAILGRGDRVDPVDPAIDTPELRDDEVVAAPPLEDAPDEPAAPSPSSTAPDASPAPGASTGTATEPDTEPEPAPGAPNDVAENRGATGQPGPALEGGPVDGEVSDPVPAPLPDDLLGAGGPAPCDQAKLADCLPAVDEDAADEQGDGAASDSDGADAAGAGDADGAQELAKRRFQPPHGG